MTAVFSISIRLTLAAILIAWLPTFGQTFQSGYRVVIRQLRVKDPGVAIKHITALIVHPLPPGKYEFVGVDLSPIGDDISNPSVKRQIALGYLNQIQRDYFAISGNGEFQQLLEKTEPIADGRSAAVAFYEGTDFSKPRSTIRISYPDAQGRLPFLNTLETFQLGGTPLENYKAQPLKSVSSDHFPADLGKVMHGPVLQWAEGIAQQMYPNDRLEHLFQGIEPQLRASAPHLFHPSRAAELQAMFSTLMQRAIDSVKDPLKLLAMNANSRKNPRDSNLKQDPMTATNDMMDKFRDYSAKHNVKLGGWPGEIKGLGHTLGTNKAEFLFGAFQMAALEGLFDYVPALLGLPVPNTFVAATAEVKARRVFPDVGIKINREFQLPPTKAGQTPQNNVVMEVTREQLGAGIADYFIRTDPNFANEDFPRYQRTRESLTREELRNRAAILLTEEVDDFSMRVTIPPNFNPKSCDFL